MSGEAVRTLILVTALGSGLVAGIFFGFSAFIMKALGRLSDENGIAAMQSINVVVINPWFFAAFFGTAAGCLGVVAAAIWGEGAAGPTAIAGAAAYLVGCILVTMAANVPLNNALARADAADSGSAALWRRYIGRWTMWNHVRTAASLAAAALLTVAYRGPG